MIKNISLTVPLQDYNKLETKLAETQVKLDKAISYLKGINRADSMVTALVITKDALVELEDK